jgi:hypothetical protein
VILYQRLKMMERSIAAIHRWADSQLWTLKVINGLVGDMTRALLAAVNRLIPLRYFDFNSTVKISWNI